MAINKYPKERRNKPIACFAGEDGSIFLLLRKPQINGITKAKATTKRGLNA
jgi:hypothetical protein